MATSGMHMAYCGVKDRHPECEECERDDFHYSQHAMSISSRLARHAPHR